MIYCFSAQKIPRIERVYTVVRKTVWQVAAASHIMIFIMEGKCMIEIGKASAVVTPGDSVFIPAGQTYKRSPVDDTMCKMMYVHFKTDDFSELESFDAAKMISHGISKADAQLLEGQRTFAPPEPYIYLSLFGQSRRDEVLELCSDVSKNVGEYRSDNSLYITFSFCRFLSLISRDTRRALLSGDLDPELVKIPKKLKKAVWYIKQNESGSITLEDLCRICNVSKSQMIRYFKDAFQKTPIQYINEYKINRAREMIQSAPELAIKNVCDALGFDDQHYFSRIFSRITGESPSQYKYRVVNFGKKDVKKDENNMKTYLFDFDGTLVDSMPAFGGAMKSVLDDFNIPYGDDIVKIVTPLGYEGSAKYFQSIGLDLPIDKILDIIRKKLVYEYTNNINAKNDVVKTLVELKKRGCSLNILTASPHLVVDPCLKRIGIFEMFDNIWSCEDFGTVKSDPNIYIAAAEKLGKKVNEVTFLDDNNYSAKTGKEAGMISIGVYDDTSKEYIDDMKSNTDGYIYSFKELI